MQEDRLRANSWEGSLDEYRLLLATTENSLACEPDNMELRFWLNSFRWMSVVKSPQPTGNREDVWRQQQAIARRIADELAVIRSQVPVFHLPYLMEG